MKSYFTISVVLACGGSTSDNSSYLVQASATSLTSPCKYTICPCSTNICRIRLDFTVSKSNTKDSFTLKGELNCRTQGVIYRITCEKCKLQYVGQSGRSFCKGVRPYNLSLICIYNCTEKMNNRNIT